MEVVHLVIQLYIWVLILSAVLSWFTPSDSSSFLAQTKDTVAKLTEPLLRPIRQIMPRPRMGGVSIDFSVWIAIIVLNVVNSLL